MQLGLCPTEIAYSLRQKLHHYLNEGRTLIDTDFNEGHTLLDDLLWT